MRRMVRKTAPLVGVLALALSGCFGSGPDNAALKAYRAALDEHCDIFRQAFTADAQAKSGPKLGVYCEYIRAGAQQELGQNYKSPEASVESNDGKIAEVVLKFAGTPKTVRFRMVQDGGDWKIADLK